jgi:hypothetical protein
MNSCKAKKLKARHSTSLGIRDIELVQPSFIPLDEPVVVLTMGNLGSTTRARTNRLSPVSNFSLRDFGS